ncbi:MAG: glycosyltransferase family 4 protein [Lachnospiraceae bacterium]|nr:glycosyltransferase family 4 protein [Lachnospiraceae bacterium]
MRILIINDYYKYGGAELAALKQRELLSACNEKVMLITFDPAYREGFIEKDVYNIKTSSNTIINILNKGCFSPSIYLKLREKVRDFAPDVIFLHGILRSPISQYLAVRGYKCIQIVHDYFYICPKFNCLLPDGSVCKGSKYRSCCKEGCRYDGSKAKLAVFKYISFVSGILRKRMVRCFVAPSKRLTAFLNAYGYKTVVINNPYDQKVVGTGKKQERTIEFLYAGRISRDKGIFEFLDAFAEWNISGKHSITVAGAFSSEDDRKRFESLEDRYGWIGYIGEKSHEEILELMGRTEFAVVPSMGIENYPTTVLDAFSSGAVVAGSARGGIREMISEGRGIGFKITDSEDIIRKLDLAVSLNEDEKDRMRQKCVKYLEDNNSEDNYLRQVMDLAESVIRR